MGKSRLLASLSGIVLGASAATGAAQAQAGFDEQCAVIEATTDIGELQTFIAANPNDPCAEVALNRLVQLTQPAGGPIDPLSLGGY